MTRLKDKQTLIIGILSMLTFIISPIVRIKPNRISMGELVSSIELFSFFSLGILFLWAIIIALSFYGNKRRYSYQILISILLLISIVLLIPIKAERLLMGTSPRISLSQGFYFQLLWVYLTIFISSKKTSQSLAINALFILLPLWVFYYASTIGLFDDLSLMKEFLTKKNQFYNNLIVHGTLTVFSVLSGMIIAIPLGFIAYRYKKAEDKVMIPLSIIETIPSLSLFGILLVPLSRLGRIGVLSNLGISGIGWAPAYIALTLYTLLPIGRNTLSGFSSVDKGIIEAAKGMGMKPLEILFKIEFPLAFPVIFTGIRIAFTQTIGGAVLAGLVGGGGLGTFVFLGLAEASPDLILLGVIPIVILTIAIDYLLRISGEAIRSGIYD